MREVVDAGEDLDLDVGQQFGQRLGRAGEVFGADDQQHRLGDRRELLGD